MNTEYNVNKMAFFISNIPRLPTDTEAHQVQTLRRVQPLHRQVRPPLSLGGELRRYVNTARTHVEGVFEDETVGGWASLWRQSGRKEGVCKS